MKKRKPCYAAKGLPKVPGKPKGTDIIPAWLTPGEAVLSPGAAEMLGRGNVQALNRAANHMQLGSPQYRAQGGLIDPSEWDGQRGQLIDTTDGWKVQGAMPEQPRMQMTDPSQFNGQNGQWVDTPNGQMIASRTDDKPFGMGMRDTENGMQPQYFMGGTGMVLGQPRYYAGGTMSVDELDKMNRQWVNTNRPQFDPGTGGSLAADTLKAIGPVEPGPRQTGSPGGMYQMPQPAINPRASDQDFVNRSVPQFMRETVKPALQAADRAISPFIPGIGAPMQASPDRPGQTYTGPTLGSTIQNAASTVSNAVRDTATGLRGSLQGMMAPKLAASDQPGTGNAMTATPLDQYMQPKPAATATPLSSPQASNPAIKPVTLGNRTFLDQASANAAKPLIDQENALANNKGGLYPNRQSVPNYLPTLGQPAQAAPRQTQAPAQSPMMRPAQQPTMPARPDNGTLNSAVANGRMGPMTDEQKAFQEYAGRQYQLMDVVRYSDDPDRVRAAAAGLGGAFNYNPGFPQVDASRENSNLDYNAKMSELQLGQPLRDAQSQEALARAGNYQSDTALQQAMLENPERFAGMRLGGANAAGGATGLRFEKLPGINPDGTEIPAVVDVNKGTYQKLKPASQPWMEPSKLQQLMKEQGIQEGSEEWLGILSSNAARLPSSK